MRTRIRSVGFAGVVVTALLALAGCDRGSSARVGESPRPTTPPSSLASVAAPPLMLAAARGEIDALETLIAAGAAPDQRGAGGLTALMAAAQRGQPDSVCRLIEVGATPDLADDTGHTALAFAARRGDTGSVACLLDAGASVERMDEQGISVLMEGIRSGAMPVIERLIAEGADLRGVTSSGWTVIHFGAASSPEVLRRLLAADPDVNSVAVNAVDAQGVTPVMRAARAGRLDLLQMLEAAGADVARADNRGWTALDHARRKKQWDVLEYLETRATPGAGQTR